MSAAEQSDLLPTGSRIGRYTIDHLASQGGFAALYRARDVESNRPVAIKLLHSRLRESAKTLVRFEREAMSIQSLRHPNIVELFDVGALPCGRPYLAMEWLPGRNLRDELRVRGPFTLRDAAATLAEIGAALAAAHAHGIVHRDVKAQNVMAIPRGDWFQCKLVDFGIAKIETPAGGTSLTTHTMLGTPKTAAPEQILGDPVGPATDIYGLGVLLFQLVTGRVPFDAPSAVELEEMHLFVAPPRPSEIAPISPALDPVVARAMAKAAEDRYPSVGAFLDAVQAATSGASPPPPRIERRRQIGVWASLVLPDGGDTDDDLLDAGDDLLLEAERLAVARGLTVAVTTATSLLATTGIERAPVVHELAATLAELSCDQAPAVGLRVAVHEADVELRRDADRPRRVAEGDQANEQTRTATSRSARSP